MNQKDLKGSEGENREKAGGGNEERDRREDTEKKGHKGDVGGWGRQSMRMSGTKAPSTGRHLREG